MEEKIRKYLTEHGLEYNHLILFPGYDVLFITHTVLYDACLYDSEGRKIWHGDVDLTKKWKLFLEASCMSKRTLILSANSLNCTTELRDVLAKIHRSYGKITNEKISRHYPIIIVRNKEDLKKDQFNTEWVFACEKKDEEVLNELNELLDYYFEPEMLDFWRLKKGERKGYA